MSESIWPRIDAETRAAWRADANARGGVPEPTDPDPHVRYMANRIVRLLDLLDEVDPVAPAPAGDSGGERG